MTPAPRAPWKPALTCGNVSARRDVGTGRDRLCGEFPPCARGRLYARPVPPCPSGTVKPALTCGNVSARPDEGPYRAASRAAAAKLLEVGR